ncbi:hypothetical protein SLA_6168 [Streptomyces laurentii]|uniref:Uncharacterized protein n=1 Tax=Streptomyces laurentii TaxID=39478 RepID=A0A160P5J2_STRLU|nr:hypothetical protein SLA_6168 [Streptomyces laurentii]
MAEIVLTNTGRDAFLKASPEFRGPGAVRAVDAVLGLLALRGADRASGVPEPTPELVRLVLVEDLPAFVWAEPAERAAYPAVVRALAGRFDGDRRARVEAAVGRTAADFERAMADPGNLTWPRWYARLLRADGTDPDDPGAVRAWLARLDRPPVPDGLRRADLVGRTAVADVVLAEVLTRAYVRDAEHAPAAGPLLADHDVAQGIGTVAHALLGRWTAAGLPDGLAGEYAHLAPGPDDLPHLDLADALLGEHLDYYGDAAVPLPPPALGLMESDPEAAAAEGVGSDPDAGGEADVERNADLLAAAVDALTGADATPDTVPYGSEAAHLLYTLYQRGCSAESVARRAAEFEDWTVDPALEDAPVRVPLPASPAYTTPTAGELARLLGAPGVNATDRARLDAPAHALAAVVDRLAATGLVFRRGDAFGLTPRGCAVVRYLLAVRGVVVPGAGETDGWDAAPWRPRPRAGRGPPPGGSSPTGCAPTATATWPGPRCSAPSALSTAAPPTPPPPARCSTSSTCPTPPPGYCAAFSPTPSPAPGRRRRCASAASPWPRARCRPRPGPCGSSTRCPARRGRWSPAVPPSTRRPRPGPAGPRPSSPPCTPPTRTRPRVSSPRSASACPEPQGSRPRTAQRRRCGNHRRPPRRGRRRGRGPAAVWRPPADSVCPLSGMPSERVCGFPGGRTAQGCRSVRSRPEGSAGPSTAAPAPRRRTPRRTPPTRSAWTARDGRPRGRRVPRRRGKAR